MTARARREVLDKGLGFPIRIINVPADHTGTSSIPLMKDDETARDILRALCFKESRLTGNEVRFLRTHLKMNPQVFAKRFCVAHATVLDWEKSGNSSTSLNWITEKDLRLFITMKIGIEPAEFLKMYNAMESEPRGRVRPILLDLENKDFLKVISQT